MRLRDMVSIARPHAITSATAMAWPFMRLTSRRSLRSRCEIKIQIPKTKFQTNSKLRIPNEMRPNSAPHSGAWRLEFFWDLDFGLWNFSSSPIQAAGRRFHFVLVNALHATIRETNHSISHPGHGGVVRDED